MKKAISISVLLLILLGDIFFIFLPKKEFSENENRYLETFPELSLSSFNSKKLQNKLDNYIADHFPFREDLISIKSNLYHFIGIYKQNDVYYGLDGALYQEVKEPVNSDYIIKKINDFSEKVDANIYFMLVPTATYINESKVPKYNLNYDEGKIIKEYKDKLLVNFIDVQNKFFESEDYNFYITDHHWTTRGAFLAYQVYCEILGINAYHFDYEMVSDKYYGTLYSKVLDNSLKYDYIEKIKTNNLFRVYFDDNNTYMNDLYDYTYLDKKDKYSFFLSGNHSLLIIENLSMENGDTLLVIKDSFANELLPFLAHHYKYIHVIDPRYYVESISEYVKKENIDNILFVYNALMIDDDIGIVNLR